MACRALAVVQCLDELLEFAVICWEVRVDSGGLTSHLSVPWLFAFETLLEATLRTAEVDDFILVFPEAIILALRHRTADYLAWVSKCVTFKAKLVEALHLAFTQNKGDVGNWDLGPTAFHGAEDGESAFFCAHYDVLDETRVVKEVLARA